MLLLLAAVVVGLLHADVTPFQTPLVIKGRSRVVTITDGLHVKKDYWYVMPERDPDVYYVEIPRHPHTVTFTTDLESISFDVVYGSRHDFVIALEDGARARTQIRAEYKALTPHRRTAAASPGDLNTIPFTRGDNDKIYVKGRINGSSELDVQVDLGAGGSIIKKSSVSKVSMHFDRTVRLRNSDGVNVVPESSANRLEIAGLAWEGIGFAVADNMTWREDAIVGNALFQDKVLEIDYDRMRLAIHDEFPQLSGGWMAAEMILDGVVPYARGTLVIGDDVREGWFLLDTGAYTSILNSDRLSPTSKLAAELRQLFGGRLRGPTLTVVGHAFTAVNYSVRHYDGDRASLGVLGNDVLKRFNLILDNRSGRAYFRPNGRMSDPFRNPEYYVVRVALLAVTSLIILTAWLLRRRSRRLRVRST